MSVAKPESASPAGYSTRPTTLETSRLILRQWRNADYAPYAAMSHDPEVMRYFPATLSRAESDERIDHYRSLIDKNGWGLWAVEVKATGDFIGFTGLHQVEPELPFAPAVEIGWRLAVPAWGKGYASEAAAEAFRYGFTDLSLAEIVAYTAVDNARSRAVMERFGMVYGYDFDHPLLPPDSPVLKHCVYFLSHEAWDKR
ncbi:MAG: Acetyltransferase [Desulfovibrio sp.]